MVAEGERDATENGGDASDGEGYVVDEESVHPRQAGHHSARHPAYSIGDAYCRHQPDRHRRLHATHLCTVYDKKHSATFRLVSLLRSVD